MSEVALKKLNAFFQKYERLILDQKSIVIRPRDTIKYIYYLESGNVRQYATTLKAEEIMLHTYSSCSYFPMMLALSNTLNTYYFETCNDVVLYKAPVSDVIEFIRSDIDVCYDLAVRLSTGLSKILLKTETLLYQDSRYKVLSILVYLSRKFGKAHDNFTRIDIPLTHSDIASWTGIQRETASRQLGQLEKKGVISYNNRFIIVNLDMLLSEEKEYKYYLARK